MERRTSTDVSRYDGSYDHVYDTTIAGVSVQAPQLDINTVAAGGGSMLFFRSGLLVVGPESAGAHPGPVCYRKGGPLTVTDANLCLGRLQPDYFPKIFGPTEDLPLDKEATIKAFEKITDQINEFNKSFSSNQSKEKLSIEEVALGFIEVANESMCRPIRAITQGKGFDTSQHILACFGGAGSQHACAIAKNLGISTIFIHKYAGILSAYGMALADVVSEAQEACAKSYCPGSLFCKLTASFHCKGGVALLVTVNLWQTRFASEGDDSALLVCHSFALSLTWQICHDKLISSQNQICCKRTCYLGPYGDSGIPVSYL
ncbi:5-oxoprolinase [Araneus ventricosus]|uniref:5-oxoprolinase n=1 Tax=Araneus ventricosus TaxID=182803 RepID=A0A4Y2LSQ8_ARAVE|nr:5-oxoprolinase [Araneus ventricosus]